MVVWLGVILLDFGMSLLTTQAVSMVYDRHEACRGLLPFFIGMRPLNPLGWIY